MCPTVYIQITAFLQVQVFVPCCKSLCFSIGSNYIFICKPCSPPSVSVVPFTLARKTEVFLKLLGNNPQTTQKPRQEKPCSGVGFFETPRETLRSYASVNANCRNIAIFCHVTFRTSGLTWPRLELAVHGRAWTATRKYFHVLLPARQIFGHAQ